MAFTPGVMACPFCGESEYLAPQERFPDIHAVLCYVCGATGPQAKIRVKALDAWNARKGVAAMETA